MQTQQTRQPQKLPEDLEIVDHSTFSQVLELDEDEGDFCKSLLATFNEQAENSLSIMETQLYVTSTHAYSYSYYLHPTCCVWVDINCRKAGDLNAVAKQAHFLKGSAAALGIKKLKFSCEKIQHAGEKRFVKDENVVFDMIKNLLVQASYEYHEAINYFSSFYGINLQEE